MASISIPIALVTDDNYVMPTIVCLQSMLANKKPESHYKIYIFTDNITEKSVELIKNISKENFDIEIIKFNNKYRNFKNTNLYITNATFIRFDIPNILEQYDKILYLDVDMIIKGDLSELYQKDISDSYAGVVFDIGELFYKLTDRTNVKNYFNAGMILYNAKRYREEGIREKLIHIYKSQYKYLPLMDQDALNIAFKNQITMLSPIYNFQQSCSEYWKNEVLKYYNVKTEDITRDKLLIIHYTRMKPWIYKFTYLKEIWDFYYSQTVFANKKLKLKSGLSLKIYLSLRGRFHLKKINSMIKTIRSIINV